MPVIGIGSRTRSKMHNVNYLNIQNLFFPLRDKFYSKYMESLKHKILKLRVLECKVYHHVLLNTKSQADFDHFLQLHMFDKTGECKDMP
jgi:hypothetical protein